MAHAQNGSGLARILDSLVASPFYMMAICALPCDTVSHPLRTQQTSGRRWSVGGSVSSRPDGTYIHLISRGSECLLSRRRATSNTTLRVQRIGPVKEQQVYVGKLQRVFSLQKRLDACQEELDPEITVARHIDPGAGLE
jgi:hypothetical protein